MQNKRNIILFVILFIITIIIFYPFLIGHYATDTYNISNVGYKNYALNWFLKDGRIFSYLLTFIFSILNISINNFSIISLFLALLISIISIIKLKDIINQYKTDENKFNFIITAGISYITIFNFMYLENLYFIESVIMSVSILLIIIASDNLVRNGKKGFVINIILIILAVFCYQGTIGFYLALVLLLSLVYNKTNIKAVIFDILKVVLTMAIAILLNILMVNVVTKITGITQTRLGSISSIFSNIIYIIQNMWLILIDSIGLFPKYLQLIFVISVLILSTIYILKNKNEKKSNIIKFVILILIIFASGFVTYVLSLTSFFTGRLRFSIGALIGLMFMYLYLTTKIFNDKIFKYIMITILYIYILTTISQYIIIMSDSKKVNVQEEQNVNEIATYIDEYEKKNNISINKIAIGIEKGQSDKTYYDNIKSKNILTYNALKCDWSVDGVIYFYSGIKLEKYYISNIDNLLKEDEEYKCIDDTLYIKVYNY